MLGVELILWDGCDFVIDYIDVEPEYGTAFFVNGTVATHYLRGLYPPVETDKE
jgi:hypothetical protein